MSYPDNDFPDLTHFGQQQQSQQQQQQQRHAHTLFENNGSSGVATSAPDATNATSSTSVHVGASASAKEWTDAAYGARRHARNNTNQNNNNNNNNGAMLEMSDNLMIGANGVPTQSKRTRIVRFIRSRTSAPILLGAFLLFLLTVGAIIWYLAWNQRILQTAAPGPVGPSGPAGVPGTLLINSTNASIPLAVDNLTVYDTLFFGDGPNASATWDPFGQCLAIEPALCTGDLTVDGTLFLNGTLNGTFAFNPLSIGDATFTEVGNGTLCLDPGALGLPLLFALDPPCSGGVNGSFDNYTLPDNTTAALVPMTGPGGESLVCLVTPNGTCFTEDIYFSETIHGKFCAQDFPYFAEGIDFGPFGYLAPVPGGSPPDVELELIGFGNLTVCAPNGTLHLGCSNVAIDGLIIVDETLDDGVCITWPSIPGEGICGDGSSDCMTVDAPCWQFDGTNVSFTNGAQVDGDLVVSGDIIVGGSFAMNISSVFINLEVSNFTDIGGNLAVGGDAEIGGGLVVGGAVVADLLTISTNLLNSGTSVFSNLVTFDSNTVLTSGHTQTITNGAKTRYLGGSTFESLSGATATCASPLFTQDSGCVFECPSNPPNFTQCMLTVGDMDVVASLRIGETGFGPNSNAQLELAARLDRADHASLFADDMEVGAERAEILGTEYARASARTLGEVFATETIAPCTPFDPLTHGAGGTGCSNVTILHNMDSSEQLGGRTLLSSLYVSEECLQGVGAFAICDLFFDRRPNFQATELLDDASCEWVPGGGSGFDSDETFALERGAALDLQAYEGHAELFATHRIEIGNGGRACDATANGPPDIVFSGRVQGLTSTDTYTLPGLLILSCVSPTNAFQPGTLGVSSMLGTSLSASGYSVPVAGFYTLTVGIEYAVPPLGVVGLEVNLALAGRTAMMCTISGAMIGVGTVNSWTCNYSTYMVANEVVTLRQFGDTCGSNTILATANTFLQITLQG